MTNKQLTKLVKKTAKECFKAGWTVKINTGLPYVAIENKIWGDDYFFQGEEAEELLNNIPEYLDVTDEEYLVYIAQGW